MPTTNLGAIVGGKYRLRSVIGEGSMGIVYRAAQLGADGEEIRDVAVKMIRTELEDASAVDATERFLREIYAAAQLRCPNCVTVYDFGRTETAGLFYAMELVDGPTLKEVLRLHSPLPLPNVLTIGGHICDALHAAHALPRPIVHRDLKPANVFIDRWPDDIWARVGDFGVAKVLGGDSTGVTAAGAPVGTPRYMSPEQCRGLNVDPRADLYALGIVLYEMVCGAPPFAGDAMEVMYRHVHDPPPPLPPHVPQKLRDLIGQLLEKNPAGRPDDARSVRESLVDVAADGSATSRESGGPLPLRSDGALTTRISRAPTADPRLGRTIGGKYRLQAILGKGPLGVVYRATQLDEQGDEVRDVALKILRSDLGRKGDEEFARSFRAEVRVAARLQSVHVLTIHDFGRADTGELYDVMQLVEGPTLKNILADRCPIPPHLGVTIGMQVCDALSEMHGLSLLHLALRPGALLLEKWPKQVWVRLREAGVVKMLGREASQILLTGVPRYRAPELWADDQSRVGPASDLYSLGAILYETLTGQPPFSGDPLSLMFQHRNEPPPPLPLSLPEQLRTLVERLLAKEPSQRPADAATVAGILASLMASVNDALSTAATVPPCEATTESGAAATNRGPQS